MRFWNDATRDHLRKLAAMGLSASQAGNVIGATKVAVLVVATRNGINIIFHTDEELAEMRAKARIREKRKRLKRRGEKVPTDVNAPIQITGSKTAPIYRNQLPRLPEMSKNELRAMLTEAVRTTAEMAL